MFPLTNIYHSSRSLFSNTFLKCSVLVLSFILVAPNLTKQNISIKWKNIYLSTSHTLIFLGVGKIPKPCAILTLPEHTWTSMQTFELYWLTATERTLICCRLPTVGFLQYLGRGLFFHHLVWKQNNKMPFPENKCRWPSFVDWLMAIHCYTSHHITHHRQKTKFIYVCYFFFLSSQEHQKHCLLCCHLLSKPTGSPYFSI